MQSRSYRVGLILEIDMQIQAVIRELLKTSLLSPVYVNPMTDIESIHSILCSSSEKFCHSTGLSVCLVNHTWKAVFE